MRQITGTGFIFIVTALAMGLIAVTAGIIRKINAMPGIVPLALFYFTAFTWVLMNVMFRAHHSPPVALAFFRYSIPAKSFAMLFLALFAFRFTNPCIKLGPHFWLSASAIPAATLALTVVGGGMFFRNISMPLLYPSKELSIIKSEWYYIDAIFRYCCLLLSIIFFARDYRVSSVLYKWRSGAFMAAASMFLVLDVFALQAAVNSDISIWVLLALCALLFFAYLYLKASDLAFLAIPSVFNKISSIILVAEENGDIMFINEPGRETFACVSGRCEGAPYQWVLDEWLSRSGGAVLNEGGGEVIRINGGGPPKYFEVLKSPIADGGGVGIGSFVELRDITVQRGLISELYRVANFDQLTGLNNRRFFDQQRALLDTEACLPLAFISADLNGLKAVNDTYGHAVGDRLIASAAQAIKDLAPENAVACRLGGDEFVVVAPNCTEAQAKSYIDKVRRHLKGRSEEPFGTIDISFGAAVRASMSDSIDKILNEADMIMYKDKNGKKISGRQHARPYNK